MAVKHKFKPIAKSDIREKVELKFRARGAVAFHLLLVLTGGLLLLYSLPYLWDTRVGSTGFQDSILAFALLGTAGALHYIRYYYRHGKGRDIHQAETDARIAQQLQHATPEEAEEQEELARLQMSDKLKNRRLLWQHLAVFVGLASLIMLLRLPHMRSGDISDWANWQAQVTIVGIWGIGLAAHVLRYYLAYNYSAVRREAKIEAQLARELRRARQRGRLQDGKACDSAASNLRSRSLEELDAVDDRFAAATIEHVHGAQQQSLR